MSLILDGMPADNVSIPVRTLPDEFVDVFIQDQTTSPFHYYLMNEQKDDITITAPIAVGDTVIAVSAGHGFTAAGEYMVGRVNGAYFQEEVLAVAVNDITIASPVGIGFPVDTTQIIRGNIEMNVDGSGADIIYRCAVAGEIPVDIQFILVTMQHPAAADDSLFGDLAALGIGLLVQKTGDPPNAQPVSTTFAQNQDFREFGGSVNYTDKAGGGNFSTNIEFDMKKVYGVVIRLDPRLSDCFSATVRDDIDALLRLRVSLMGQLTLGE